ncbi:hypothetical protein Gotur_018990 [Gossypium turneri]
MNLGQEPEDAVGFSVGIIRSPGEGQRPREHRFDHAELDDFHCLASVGNQRKYKTNVEGNLEC